MCLINPSWMQTCEPTDLLILRDLGLSPRRGFFCHSSFVPFRSVLLLHQICLSLSLPHLQLFIPVSPCPLGTCLSLRGGPFFSHPVVPSLLGCQTLICNISGPLTSARIDRQNLGTTRYFCADSLPSYADPAQRAR